MQNPLALLRNTSISSHVVTSQQTKPLHIVLLCHINVEIHAKTNLPEAEFYSSPLSFFHDLATFFRSIWILQDFREK
ncbi:MAG: hypothetical protein RI993_295 [Pseudomonadota bacterium]|jgi:hypothetical protein